MCACVEEHDGFNLSQRGEPQFQFLDVTDNTEPQAVTGATHYYASLAPPQPQPMYLIIDQSGSAGTVLTTSGYVAPVQPMIPPQMQSGGVMLPPGIIPATRSLIGPPLLRPGLIQQSPVIMPNALVPQPAPALAPTTMLPGHGTMLPLAPSVSHMPVAPVSELPLNATATLVAGYSGQPLHAGVNGLDNPMTVDMRVSCNSPQHEDVYVPDRGRNVNNSAAQQSQSDILLPVTEHTPVNFEGSVDRSELEDGNGLVTYDECSGSDTGMPAATASSAAAAAASSSSAAAAAASSSSAAAGVDSCVVAASMNGELSVDALHDMSNSSETSSVTSPSSVLTDMTLNDNVAHNDGTVNKDSGQSCSPVMTVSSTQASSTTAVSTASSSVKTKAPSWASLLKDTTTATNAIVINVNDGQSVVTTQQKADAKSIVKEPTTQQSAVSHVSNDVKLKLQISGLYVLLSGSCNCSGSDKCCNHLL